MSKKLGNLFQKLMIVAVTLAMVLCIIAPADAQAAEKKLAFNAVEKDIAIGKSFDFNIKNKIKGATYEWSVSNKDVLTVNHVGLVTGIAVGKSNVVCKVNVKGAIYRLSARVNVVKPAAKVTITNPIDSMNVKDFYQLKADIMPKSSNDYITWTTSDSTVARIDQNGEFIIRKEGIVTFTATAVSGRKDSVTVYIGADALANKPEDGKDVTGPTKPTRPGKDSGIIHAEDFSQSIGDYTNRGSAVLTQVNEVGAEGKKGYLSITGRTSSWNGALVDLTSIAVPGESYNVTAWVKFDQGNSVEVIKATQENSIDGTAGYPQISGSVSVNKGEWTKISGVMSVDPNTSKCFLYFEADSLIDFYVDNVEVELIK